MDLTDPLYRKIDWAPFDGHPLDICTCRCGKVYLSHSKGVYNGERFVVITRTPCPDCNNVDKCWKVSSPPETTTL